MGLAPTTFTPTEGSSKRRDRDTEVSRWVCPAGEVAHRRTRWSSRATAWMVLRRDLPAR